MRRKTILATLAVAMMMVALPQAASAVKPSNKCAPGFDLGALTLGESLLLPNVQAGLTDGIFDVTDLNALFGSVDGNDDGLICFQSYSSNANPASEQQYAYNVVDNNASVPSG